jgi:hypothetical protein
VHAELMNHTLGKALAGLLLVASLAGCGNAQSAKPVTTSGSIAVIDMATRSGTWPVADSVLQNAVNQLDRECLRVNGFDYPPLPEVVDPIPEDEVAAIDLPRRSRVGYGISRPPEAQPRDTFYDHLSQAEQVRFTDTQFGKGKPRVDVPIYGSEHAQVPDGGCVAESRRWLAGDVATWARLTYLPQRFDDQLSTQAMRSVRYLDTLAEWRTCMRRHGHPYSSPDDAVAALRATYDTTLAFTDREIAVATTDGICATTTHLPSTLLKVRRAFAAQLPAKDVQLLNTLAHAQRGALRRARSVRPR